MGRWIWECMLYVKNELIRRENGWIIYYVSIHVYFLWSMFSPFLVLFIFSITDSSKSTQGYTKLPT